MRFILLFLLSTILFSACSDKGINDTDKRNENWCWHVSKETGKGEWMPLGGNNSLPDGWYTTFYSNRNVFEKGKTQDGTQIDTISSFDLSGKISKYTYYSLDTSYEYYINDGPFKAWNNKTELTEEGIVKDHKISEQKWHGNFAHFYTVIDICYDSKKAIKTLTKKVKEVMNPEEEVTKTLRPVAANDIHILDSLINNVLLVNKVCLNKLNQVEISTEMPEFKKSAIELINMHKRLMTEGISKSLEILKTGYCEDNMNKINELMRKLDWALKIERNFSDEQEEFQQKLELDFGQIQYLKEKFPEAVISH